jgi:cytosine/adenosine deaminase-related metal-dependent hydrolase
VQSVFQAMKMFCLLAAVSEPEPGPPLAHEVLRHATLGNARTAGLAGKSRRHQARPQGRLVLIDLRTSLIFRTTARRGSSSTRRPAVA